MAQPRLQLADKTALAVSEFIATHENPIMMSSIKLLAPKTRQGLYAIYCFAHTARIIAENPDSQQAKHDLAMFKRATEEAIETKRSSNPILKAFSDTLHAFKIDEALIEAMFAGLKMETTHTSFTLSEYRRYIEGTAESVALMCLRVITKGRAPLYTKLTPAARKFGAAICKVNLVMEHGQVHRRHGKMYFPEITKHTFNRARLAQVIIDVEADFRVAREGIMLLPPTYRRAAAMMYAQYYEYLRQMRHHTPEEIDAGALKISPFKQYVIMTHAFVAPRSALHRGKL